MFGRAAKLPIPLWKLFLQWSGGDTVQIIVRTEGIAVSAPGTARAAGGLGEIIPVENTLSRKVVYGRIVAPAYCGSGHKGVEYSMKIKAYFRRCIVLCVVLLLAGTITASATSLYPIDKPSLYEDQKARRPGDLVTVIIVEQAQARQNANTAAGKNSDVSVGPGHGVLSDLIPLFKLGGG